MTVYVYSSSDSGAPALTNDAGSLASLLKACLVGSGGVAYGAKSSAGWTATIDNANVKLLRNSAVNGSGLYFRIKDDGIQESTQSTPDYRLATITGAKDYTDIDTLEIPFPRTITGINRHNNTYYGCAIFKNGAANSSHAVPWRIIADDVTCYLFIANNVTNSTAIESTSYSNSLRVYGFGELSLLQNITNYPKGFIAPGIFEAYDSYGYDSDSLISTGTKGFIEHPTDAQNYSSKMYVLPGISSASLHGGSATGTSLGMYHLYPSPITGGVVFEDIFICDDTNNVVRTVKHTGYETERFAKLRGVQGCCHSLIAGASMGIGENWDVVTADGRDYMLIQLAGKNVAGNASTGTFAFDMTGPWS